MHKIIFSGVYDMIDMIYLYSLIYFFIIEILYINNILLLLFSFSLQKWAFFYDKIKII